MKYNKITKLLTYFLCISIPAGTITGCGSSKEITISSSSVSADNMYASSSFTTGNNINSSSASKSTSETKEKTGTVENGAKYLKELDYDNAILEFKSVIEKDRHNIKAIAGLYAAYTAKKSKKDATKVLDDMKEAGVSEEAVITAVLDYAESISESDTDAANTVRNAIGTVALNDNYDKLAKQAFSSVLESDENNKDAISGLKKLEEKEASSNNTGTTQTETKATESSGEASESTGDTEKSSSQNTASKSGSTSGTTTDETTDTGNTSDTTEDCPQADPVPATIDTIEDDENVNSEECPPIPDDDPTEDVIDTSSTDWDF